MMQSGSPIVFFLGSSGFPKGLAEVEKQKLISRGLVEAGAKVIIICSHGVNDRSDNIPRKGYLNGVYYYYSSIITYRPHTVILRFLSKLIGSIIEIYFLLFHDFDVVIVNSRSFRQVLKYKIIAKLKRKKVYLTVVEAPSHFNSRSFFLGLDRKLFNKYVWLLLDGAFPISEYLQAHIEKMNPALPQLKVPILVDYRLYENIVKDYSEKYYLFCGAAAYIDIIKFIIDSYELINNTDYKLFIVANGNVQEREKITQLIRKSKKNSLINFFNYLEYDKLAFLYSNASALLIPLRSNIKDIARFPHKIGEYLASGNPIITTNIGEIVFYFKNFENALISQNYDCQEYSEMMKFIINNPEKSKRIGEKGRLLAQENFDYKNNGIIIYNFLVKNIAFNKHSKKDTYK